jgi:hypothetical protein
MNTLDTELARALMADRERDIDALQRRRQARLTPLAAKRPEPAGHRAPGLLAHLLPWFGAGVRTA